MKVLEKFKTTFIMKETTKKWVSSPSNKAYHIMVVVAGNEHSNQSSNSGCGPFMFYWVLMSLKRHLSIFSSPLSG